MGGLPAEEEQLPPEGDNSGRSSNTYFLSSSRLRQTTQNYKKMFKIDDLLGAATLTNSDSNLEIEISTPQDAHKPKSFESFVSTLSGQPFIFRAVSQWWHIS